MILGWGIPTALKLFHSGKSRENDDLFHWKMTHRHASCCSPAEVLGLAVSWACEKRLEHSSERYGRLVVHLTSHWNHHPKDVPPEWELAHEALVGFCPSNDTPWSLKKRKEKQRKHPKRSRYMIIRHGLNDFSRVLPMTGFFPVSSKKPRTGAGCPPKL